MVPYPSWLNAGDNSWQMTAATLVGLMSIPALAVLYGGLVQKKWAMNTIMMVFSTFCLTSSPGSCGPSRWASARRWSTPSSVTRGPSSGTSPNRARRTSR